MFARLRSFLAGLIHRNRFESSMDDELRFHMAAYADDLVRAGVPRDEAMRRARLQFGAVEAVKEECRQNRGMRWIDEARQDLRYSVRMMVKTPVFTIAVILSLALGIGANTAIFSLMDAVLFRTLPLPEPEALYFLAHDPGPDVSTSSNYPIFERYRAAPVFSGVTAYRGRTFNVSTAEGVERLPGQFVSGNYHAVLGAPMSLGRGFASEADRGPASFVAVISHDYWMTRFGGSPGVVDRTLNVGGRVVTIVGVTAPGFRGLEPGGRVDITLPMSVMALDAPTFFDATDGWTSLVLVGRLAPGVAEPRAIAAVDAIFQQFLSEPPSAWVKAGARGRFRAGTIEPAARGTWNLRRTYSTPLLVLMGMVAVVLLMACANVANLLLARATARSREVAIRLGIGASRARLVRQFLTESLMLGLSGGALGVLLSPAGTQAILALFSDPQSPLLLDAALNGRVLAFTTAVSTLTGVAFGIVPALRGTGVELAPTLKQGSGPAFSLRGPLAGKSLVIAQFALCVMMVAGAALLSRSLRNLEGFDAGFVRSNIVVADLDTTPATLSPEARAVFYAGLIERLHTRPGVRSVTLAARTPIDRSSQLRRIEVGAVPPTPEGGVSVNPVTPGYFETFGIDLIRGRGLVRADRESSASVALVSQSMARYYFGDRDPTGETFVLGGNKHRTTIVGVVDDVRHEALRTVAPPKMVYTPLFQRSADLEGRILLPAQLTLAVRTDADPAALPLVVRGEIRSLNRDVLVHSVRTMEQQIDATLIPERLLAKLSTAFALGALLLACVGLYGVMSYNVARRAREIGIRIALGAIPRVVLWRVLRETLTVSIAGIAAGLLLALAATRTVSTFLFGLSPYDPATLASTTILLLIIALAAGFVPARRAAAVDPVTVLRND